MFYLNRVILAGKLQEDPEVRYSPRGTPVIFFTLHLPAEQLEEESLLRDPVSIRVMLVGEQSESWAKQKGKGGGNVLVEGGLVQRRWETVEGQMKKEIGIIAHTVRDLR